jgi:hypothetical protein
VFRQQPWFRLGKLLGERKYSISGVKKMQFSLYESDTGLFFTLPQRLTASSKPKKALTTNVMLIASKG